MHLGADLGFPLTLLPDKAMINVGRPTGAGRLRIWVSVRVLQAGTLCSSHCVRWMTPELCSNYALVWSRYLQIWIYSRTPELEAEQSVSYRGRKHVSVGSGTHWLRLQWLMPCQEHRCWPLHTQVHPRSWPTAERYLTCHAWWRFCSFVKVWWGNPQDNMLCVLQALGNPALKSWVLGLTLYAGSLVSSCGPVLHRGKREDSNWHV